MGRFSQGSEMKGGMEGSGGGVPLGGKANGGWKSTWLMGSMGSRIWGVWFLLVNSFGCYAGVGGITAWMLAPSVLSSRFRFGFNC